MNKKIICILFYFFPLCSYSQNGTITGLVTDNNTGQPVSGVNVFLNNATKGTRTNERGEFILNGIKTGEYELIASMLGYAVHGQDITVSETKQLITIKLVKKAVELQEVVVRPDPNRARNLEEFKLNFIGRTPNASLCKIINPEVLRLSYAANNRELLASSDQFLLIENKALGYKLKYLLSEFNKNYDSGMTYYEGPVLFEDLKGSKSQIKKWERNRLEAYLGSSMHFYRSLYDNKLADNGFVLHTLIRKNNPSRLPDSLIKAKIKGFMSGSKFPMQMSDSLSYWMGQSRMPKIVEMLVKDPLHTSDILTHSDDKKLPAISFKDYLYVIYTKKHDSHSNIYRPASMPDYATSIITLTDPYVPFDANGIVTNPRSVIYEGYWTTGIAEMLPNDYEPDL